jgi:hypothetical protein
LTEKVHELKLTNAQQNNVIGNLKLQIRAEEFPYQQKVKELEERVSFYKSKVRQMETFHEMENTLKGCNIKLLLWCFLVGQCLLIIMPCPWKSCSVLYCSIKPRRRDHK